MKLSLLFCCVVLLAASPSAMACGNGHHGNLLSQLDLTPAQKAGIAKILHSAEPRRVKHQEIMAMLTPAQRAELKQFSHHKV